MLSSYLVVIVPVSLAGVDLRSDGAFGFPQRDATVLCDTPELRFSVACDGEYLFAQAILWKDGDDALGSTDDGRKIGDRSDLVIDCDADGKATGELDREYMLDPWPSLPGLHYQVVFDERSSSGITGDSKGRGSIQYLASAGGTKVRVDTYLIPLEELARAPGQEVRFAYWASSTAPPLIVNSLGYQPPGGRKYWASQLPRERHHSLQLARKAGASPFDVQQVPEGRDSIVVQAKRDPPKVGTTVGEAGGPPEVSAAAWLNWTGAAPPSLASLRGKVVVVEFWATWCGPCVAGIPHLDRLHDEHAEEGLVILSLTDQERGPIQEFVSKKGDGMSYAVGAGSETLDAYGVTGIPYAFVIDRQGKLVWAGHPAGKELDQAVLDALGKD